MSDLPWTVSVNDDVPQASQQLQLLRSQLRHHLSGQDLRSLIQYLERDDIGFEATPQVSDPSHQPELWSCIAW